MYRTWLLLLTEEVQGGHQVGSDLLQRGCCPLLTGQQRLEPGPDHVHLSPHFYP